jgi:hypothetical protein
VQAAAEVVDEGGSAKVVVVVQQPGQRATILRGCTAWKIKPAADLLVTGDAPALLNRVILLDGIVYGRADPAAVAEMHGRHWMKLEPGAPARSGGPDAGTAAWGQVLNPGSDLRGLAAAARLEAHGEERLGELRAAHYRGVAKAADLLEAEKGLTGEQLDWLLGRLRGDGSSSVAVDLWLDEDSRLVRMVERTETALGVETVTASYSDYGTLVNIQAPPVADTADAGDVGHAAVRIL